VLSVSCFPTAESDTCTLVARGFFFDIYVSSDVMLMYVKKLQEVVRVVPTRQE